MKIALIGTGYIGSAFICESLIRGHSVTILTRNDIPNLASRLRAERVDAVINAAGFTGKPNVDDCELIENAEALWEGNVELPGKLMDACDEAGIPLGHVSTGCIYNGNGPWKEEDAPNHTGAAYGRSKIAAERLLAGRSAYLWRLRIPFDDSSSPRNYLNKLLAYDTLLTDANSITHRGYFAKSALRLLELRAPFGVYNMTNPGAITPEEIVGMMRERGIKVPPKRYVPCSQLTGIVAPRSNCILDTSKLEAVGAGMPPVRDAIRNTLLRFYA